MRHGTTNVRSGHGAAALKPEQLARLHRLGRELRLTDQILSDDVDTVNIDDSLMLRAPASTSLDGTTITFALQHLPQPESRYDLAVWLGVNAHELGHVLFSPRKGSTLMRRVLTAEGTMAAGIAMVHNIVEDQRQERLLLGHFAPWRGYLAAALTHLLRADDEGAWVLLCGRTWLSAEARAQARAAFAAVHGDEATNTVARIVGDYQRLDDPAEDESDEAYALVAELHKLLGSQVPPSHECTVMQGTGSGEGDTTSVTLPAAADETNEDEGDDDDEAEAEGDDDGEADDGEADDGEADEAEAGKGDDDEGDEPGDDEADDDEGQGEGESDDDTLAGKLRASAEAALDDDATADDLDRVVEALDAGGVGHGAEGNATSGAYGETTDAARRLEHDVTDALLELKDASEPGWVKRTDSGRLNVRRWATDPNADLDNLFDRYEPGQLDAADLEVVLLLDVSGSMHGQVARLAEATWAIRHAVDALEGRCTVITYSDGHQVMAQPDERPDDRMFTPQANGGTSPLSALREAYLIVADSQAPTRLVLMLTDGQWFGGEDCTQVIESMHELGVLTALAFLGWSSYMGAEPPSYGAKNAATIDHPGELARLFEQIAADSIRVRL
jgi:hypothetical protein